MLSKILLLILLLVAFAKFGLREKLRELGRRFDRVINATFIAILLVYTAQVVWWLVQGR